MTTPDDTEHDATLAEIAGNVARCRRALEQLGDIHTGFYKVKGIGH